jgi:succinate---hydroxymethylglutarate CoA-transferase
MACTPRLPLEGVRIIAVEQYGALPFGTMHLADLGAEVIKIEDPARGDIGRFVGPYAEDGDSLFYQSLNRNKRSVSLDLRSEFGRRVLHDLVRVSDAVANNLRGDLPAKLGLTYEALGKVNPRIVTASLTGFGLTGPRAAQPGYDYLAQALAGFMSVTGEPDDPPIRCGLSIVDFMSGIAAALGIVSAVLSARESGRGMDVDVSLLDVAVSNLNYLAAWYLNEGYLPSRAPNGAHPSLVPSQRFRTRNGYMYVMCNKEKFWANLCDVLRRPEWKQEPRYRDFSARYENREWLLPELQEALLERTTEEWLEAFGDSVPCARVNTIDEALAEPQVLARDMIIEVPHDRRGTVKEISCPIKVDGAPVPRNAAPTLGGDTEYVLRDVLGYLESEISKIAESEAR